MTKNRGITMISLVITMIVLIIITGVTLGIVANNNGVLTHTVETKGTVEKETLIQKIQSDLFKEKTKKGRELTQAEKESIIDDYGTITVKEGVKVLTTAEGGYEILLSEIIL